MGTWIHRETNVLPCILSDTDADGPIEKDAGGEAYHSSRVIQYCN